MSATATPRPPARLAGGHEDVRSIRPWLNSLRDAVSALADASALSKRLASRPQDARRVPPFGVYVTEVAGLDGVRSGWNLYADGGRIIVTSDNQQLTVADASLGFIDDAAHYVTLRITRGIASATWAAQLAEYAAGSYALDAITGWHIEGSPGDEVASFGLLIAEVAAGAVVQHHAGAFQWHKMPSWCVVALKSSAAAPNGFVLCDGTLGTDDLTGRTIYGLDGLHTDGQLLGSTTHVHNQTGSGQAANAAGADVALRAQNTDTGDSFQPSMCLRYYMAL